MAEKPCAILKTSIRSARFRQSLCNLGQVGYVC